MDIYAIIFQKLDIPLWKRVFCIRKEFAPSGSKFFPYRVNSFFRTGQNAILTEFLPLIVYLLMSFLCK